MSCPGMSAGDIAYSTSLRAHQAEVQRGESSAGLPLPCSFVGLGYLIFWGITTDDPNRGNCQYETLGLECVDDYPNQP